MLQVNEVLLPNSTSPISFRVGPKEVLLLGGPSGEGKSTLARRIAGLPIHANDSLDNHGSAPSITVQGQPLLISQNYEDVLSQGLKIGPGCRRLLRMDQRIERRKGWHRFVENMNTLGLDPSITQRLPREVSGGQLQRVLISLGLAASASIVIFDETLVGLDGINKENACGLIERRSAELGKAVLIIGHDDYLHGRFRSLRSSC